MLHALHRLEKPRSPSGERGFALSEVLIAILIIGATLLTLLAASASSFSLQKLGRERQTAVGIANEVMEETRTLGYKTLRAGTFEADTHSDTQHVAKCADEYRLKNFDAADPCALGDGLGEIVMTTDVGSSGCLPAVSLKDLPVPTTRPLMPNCTAYVVDKVEYRAFVFITQAQAQLDLYRISVIVNWPYVNGTLSAASSKRVVVQSMFGQNAGCAGKLVDSLLPGPCGNATQKSLVLPAPKLTVKYDATHWAKIDLGELQLTWDEPATGEMSLQSEYVPPSATVVNGGTQVSFPLGAVSGMKLLERDSLKETDTPDTGTSQYMGVAIDTGGTVPDVTNAWPLEGVSLQIPGTNPALWLVGEWRLPPSSGCNGTLPNATSTWFACAELDAEALTGTCLVPGASAPCVGAVLSLPTLDFCVNTGNAACPQSAAGTPIVAGLSGSPTVKAILTKSSSVTELAMTFGGGYANSLKSSLSYPTYPLLKYFTTGGYPPLWQGLGDPSTQNQPSGCNHDNATMTYGSAATHCYVSSQTQNNKKIVTGFRVVRDAEAVGGIWSLAWYWHSCEKSNLNFAITNCGLKFASPGLSSLTVTIDSGAPDEGSPPSGSGW